MPNLLKTYFEDNDDYNFYVCCYIVVYLILDSTIVLSLYIYVIISGGVSIYIL